jgi:phosphocarrier protein HPr
VGHLGYAGVSDETCTATLEIVNKLGLHARAAVLFVQASTKFEAKVRVSKDGQDVDGRSIMGVMMLAAEQGSLIEVETSGPDARAALDAITTLVANKFNESE